MITADLLEQVPLFTSLPLAGREAIAIKAADVRLQKGEWLIQEGEIPAFFVLLEGAIAVIKKLGRSEEVISHYEPYQYFGEVPLLLGSPAVASLRAEEPVRAMRLDASDFHALILGHPELSNQLLRTMAERVQHLQQLAVETPISEVKIIGHHWDLECLNLRDFLGRNHIAFQWLDLDDPQDADLVPPEALHADVYPLVILPNGDTLTAPTPRSLAGALGLRTEPSTYYYDVAIVGGGPAGLAAAVYGASEGLNTIMIEREAPGGQAGTSSRIENYLGFPAGLSGDELSQRAWHQADRFGAEILVAREVTGLDPSPDNRDVLIDGGDRVHARAIVIATGVAWRRLSVPGIEEFVGRGVYYGASRTEAPATRGKDIYLVGGGNSAGQAALFFAGYARTVTLLVREEALSISMSQYLIDQLASKGNISVAPSHEVAAVQGNGHLEAIMVRDCLSGKERRFQTDALFVFIGADAETDWLPPAIARDQRGYILTGRSILSHEEARRLWPLERDPYLLETTVPGIFAAGDVRHGSVKRVASAVGEGSMAIAFVHQYLATAEAADGPVPSSSANSH